jgi:hypothetical protein
MLWQGMSFFVNNQNIFRQIELHMLLTQGMETICTDQSPTSHFFSRKCIYYSGIKIFNSLPSSLKTVTNKKAHF